MTDNEAATYPTAWSKVYTATIEQAIFDMKTITLRLRDRMFELHVPIPLNVFAGDNALPAGLEGNADDLKNKIKPLIQGKVFNISPPCCNTSKLIYAVSPPTAGDSDLVTDWDAITVFDAIADFFGSSLGGAGINNVTVYDAGLALTAGADYTDEADLLANAPAAGQFRVLKAQGYVRLGSAPAGQITCDCTDNSSGTYLAGALIQNILTKYLKWDASRFSAADLAALDTACTIPMGYLVSGITYIDDVFDKICYSVGAFYTFDQNGVFRVFRFEDLTGKTATMALSDSIIEGIERLPMPIPSKSVRIRHSKNYTVQTSGVAGAVTAARKSWLSTEWRDNVASNASTRIKHLLATEMVVESLFTADTQTETDRRMNLYATRRDLIKIKLVTGTYSFSQFRLGDIITLDLSGRYGYSGKNMMLIGLEVDLARDRISLKLWG